MYSPDILGLSETWPDPTMDDSLVSIPGFNVFRVDRHRHGGGVAVFVNDKLCGKRVYIDSSPTTAESLWLEVSSPSIPATILVGCIYRPPSLNTDCIHSICNQIDQALTMRKHVVVCGDVNVNLLNTSHAQTIFLSEYIATRDLLQPIVSPTRITNHSATLIDIFLVSAREIVKSATVIDLGISDHAAISLNLSWRKPKLLPQMIEYRSFKAFDPDKFRQDLLEAPWSVLEIFDDTDDKIDYFNKIFTQTLNKHAPLRKLRVEKNGSPWVTSDIRDQMDIRRKLLRHFRLTRSENDWELYGRQRNKVTALLRNSKSNYFSNLITNKVHPSTLWRILKSTLPTPKPNWASFEESAESLANRFNRHFVSATPTLPVSVPTPCDSPTSTVSPDLMSLPCMTLNTIKPEECETRLSHLDPHKSTGLDGIPSAMLNIASSAIASPLCSIINSSITSHFYPSAWKKALVKPLHKGGPRDTLTNYQPISLLPVASKVLEGVVRDQVYSHLLSHDLLSPWQSGFHPGHSTTTTLLHLTNKCHSALDKGQVVGAIFLDISKAFDTVDHALLLSRLVELGLDSDGYQWFNSYVSHRSQCMVIDSNYSTDLAVTSGVPQGSVLGPLLF